jgi:hypothetical protein
VHTRSKKKEREGHKNSHDNNTQKAGGLRSDVLSIVGANTICAGYSLVPIAMNNGIIGRLPSHGERAGERA